MSAGLSSAPLLASQTLASIPSPTQSVWHLGPLPIRAYALCIVLGIFVALAITERRWKARGGQPDQLGDIAAWGIIFGIIGGRLYHVITTPDPYFGQGGHPFNVVKIYEGGLGIWGAVALGGLGVYIGCRRKGVRFTVFADAAVPGIVLAQAFGRWGNYFNNELYGRRTDLPWGLEIHQISVDTGKAAVDADGNAIVLGTFHPTFLYESLWCVLVFLALLAVDRRYRMGRGRLAALYAVLYSIGRGAIESMRIDETHHLFGLRLNEWTSLAVIIGGIAWILTHPGPRETSVFRDDADSDDADSDDADSDDAQAGSAQSVDGEDSASRTAAASDNETDTAERDEGGADKADTDPGERAHS